jgi:hypothetical protein
VNEPWARGLPFACGSLTQRRSRVGKCPGRGRLTIVRGATLPRCQPQIQPRQSQSERSRRRSWPRTATRRSLEHDGQECASVWPRRPRPARRTRPIPLLPNDGGLDAAVPAAETAAVHMGVVVDRRRLAGWQCAVSAHWGRCGERDACESPEDARSLSCGHELRQRTRTTREEDHALRPATDRRPGCSSPVGTLRTGGRR